MPKQFKADDIIKTISLARDNRIKISYQNGVAHLTLPSGYLYYGATGLSLDVAGLTRLAAWAEIAKDVQELVDNKSNWEKQVEN